MTTPRLTTEQVQELGEGTTESPWCIQGGHNDYQIVHPESHKDGWAIGPTVLNIDARDPVPTRADADLMAAAAELRLDLLDSRAHEQRLWDLVRRASGDLYQEGHLSDKEYAALAADWDAGKRLKTYTEMKAALESKQHTVENYDLITNALPASIRRVVINAYPLAHNGMNKQNMEQHLADALTSQQASTVNSVFASALGDEIEQVHAEHAGDKAAKEIHDLELEPLLEQTP